MSVSRRRFLKYCAGSAAALGLELSSLGPLGRKALAGGAISYPISKDVQTTLVRTVISSGSPVLPDPYPPTGPPPTYASIYPCQISLYTQNQYGEWAQNPTGIPAGPAFPYCAIDMNTGVATSPSVPDPSAVTLLSFFTMSDVHICDKESPAQSIYNAYQYPYPAIPSSGPLVVPPNPVLEAKPAGGISSYSGIILYTTQVLDAGIQTINALHKQAPFDFGIAPGDACDNTQYNLNSDHETISILVIDVDPAVNPAPLRDGSQSPALISRSYSIAAQQIFGSPIQQYPAIASIDPQSGVCNAELVIQLSQLTPGLQEKILNISPVISSFKISTTSALAKSYTVILDNTVGGSVPVEYMASQSSSFSGAVWQPYSQAPCFTLSPSTTGSTTVYFKVKDGSGKQSAAASELLRGGGAV